LAQAVLEFLQNEIAPQIQDARLKFRMLVASNGLGILARELAQGEALLQKEWLRLSALLQTSQAKPSGLAELRAEVLKLNRTLTARIRADRAPPDTYEAVKDLARDKLRIASPRYLERYRP